jgi:hypothetical protein
MPPILNLPGPPGDDDDWRARRGPYAGLDPDTPDRPQVKPVFEPPAGQQVHDGA